MAEDAIVWSTLLSILPSLTGEEDVSDGQCLEQRRWLSAVPVSRQGFDNTVSTQNIIAAVCVNWPNSYAAVHKEEERRRKIY